MPKQFTGRLPMHCETTGAECPNLTLFVTRDECTRNGRSVKTIYAAVLALLTLFCALVTLTYNTASSACTKVQVFDVEFHSHQSRQEEAEKNTQTLLAQIRDEIREQRKLLDNILRSNPPPK